MTPHVILTSIDFNPIHLAEALLPMKKPRKGNLADFAAHFDIIPAPGPYAEPVHVLREQGNLKTDVVAEFATFVDGSDPNQGVTSLHITTVDLDGYGFEALITNNPRFTPGTSDIPSKLESLKLLHPRAMDAEHRDAELRQAKRKINLEQYPEFGPSEIVRTAAIMAKGESFRGKVGGRIIRHTPSTFVDAMTTANAQRLIAMFNANTGFDVLSNDRPVLSAKRQAPRRLPK